MASVAPSGAHLRVVDRPDDGKSAGKPDAVQTLRANRCASHSRSVWSAVSLLPLSRRVARSLGTGSALGGPSALLNFQVHRFSVMAPVASAARSVLSEVLPWPSARIQTKKGGRTFVRPP